MALYILFPNKHLFTTCKFIQRKHAVKCTLLAIVFSASLVADTCSAKNSLSLSRYHFEYQNRGKLEIYYFFNLALNDDMKHKHKVVSNNEK